MDVQAGQHDFTVYAQGFSHWKRGADDAHVEGWEYKRRACMSLGALI